MLKVLAIIFIAFVVFVIYSANNNSVPLFIRELYMFPGGDKVGHIGLFGTLSFFVNHLLYPRAFAVRGRAIFMGTVVVALVITLEEMSQAIIAARTFDLVDLCCSYVGILLGDVGVRFFHGRRKMRTQSVRSDERA